MTVGAISLLATACGIPVGFSAVLLPQLIGANTTAEEIHLDIEMGSWIASIHTLATPCGAFLSGSLADYFGRRKSLMLSCVPMIIGWCIIASAQSFYVLLTGRFVCGFATGTLGGPAQVYIAETSSPKIRGLLIGTTYVFYSVGVVIVYTLGVSLHWRLVSWMGTILPLIAIIALFCVPESPSWLLRHNKIERALKSLTMLRGHKTLAEDELKIMQKRLSDDLAATKTKENIIQLCCKRMAYKPLMLVIVMSQLQLFTGTYLVIFYAADFIHEIGGTFNMKASIIWTAVVRTACTMMFCGILMVVRRRTLVTVSCLGSGIIGFILTAFLYANADKVLSSIDVLVVCACLLIYIIFNTPMMIVHGVMVGELLPASVRGRCAGFIFSSMNILLFVLAKYFPYMQNALKLRGVFFIFGLANILCAIFMYLFQPETKGRTLDEIENYFNEDNWLWSRRDESYNKVKHADNSLAKA